MLKTCISFFQNAFSYHDNGIQLLKTNECSGVYGSCDVSAFL